MPTTNSSDLSVRVLRQAPEGRVLQAGDAVWVHYSGKLLNGTTFDESFNFNGFQPVPNRNLFAFVLGKGQVIQGWDQGLLGHRVGEALQLIIPPDLGYGSTANGDIPANSTLVFKVLLAGMVPADQLALQPVLWQPEVCDLRSLGLTARRLGLDPALLATLPTSSRSQNFLVGTDEADTITGQADPGVRVDPTELLIGLNGNDRIYGGSGRDIEVGGKGGDTFIFQTLKESRTGTNNRDLISDFQGGLGGDRLDLSAIDWNPAQPGIQPLRFVGGAEFSGSAGEVRYQGGLVSADGNGDGVADMEIGLLGAPSLAASDLLL